MIIDAYSNKNPHNLYICQTTGKSKTGSGKRDINNTNVREAIVRPKGDKNINQQQLRVQQHIACSGGLRDRNKQPKRR